MPAKRIIFNPSATADDYASIIDACFTRCIQLDPYVDSDNRPCFIIYTCPDDDEEALNGIIKECCSENAVSMKDW